MTSESRRQFEEWREKEPWYEVTKPDEGDEQSDAGSVHRIANIAASRAWSARDSEVERLREALSQVRTVIALQRDLIERGKHAAAWNPVISQIDAALSSQVKESGK